MLPSGFHLSHCVNIIGNGCVINLPMLFEEIKEKESQGISDWSKRLLISDRAHISKISIWFFLCKACTRSYNLVFEFHKEVDVLIDEQRGKTK